MARGKARFEGSATAPLRYDAEAIRRAIFAAIPAFRRYPRSLLDRLPPEQYAQIERWVADRYWRVVEDIEAALWQAAWALAEARRDSTVADRRAEAAKLVRLLDRGEWERVREKLPALSRDVVQSLRAVGVNPMEPALLLATLRTALVQLRTLNLPARRRPADVRRKVCERLACELHAALSPHATALGLGLTMGSYDDADAGDLPRLIHTLAGAVGLWLSPLTWRKRLLETRKMGSMQVLRCRKSGNIVSVVTTPATAERKTTRCKEIRNTRVN